MSQTYPGQKMTSDADEMNPLFQFDPLNPIPITTDQDTHLRAEQNHSEKLDEWLGFEIEKTEALISNQAHANKPQDQNFWVDLAPRTLMTPYTEILRICRKLKLQPQQKIIDLGAAYGRMGYVLDKFYPGTTFVGYESVEARTSEGQRILLKHNCQNARMIHADLTAKDTIIESADVYFIYDFGSSHAIREVLESLRKLAQHGQPITMVGRGVRSRDMIEKHAAWLSQVHRPVHFSQYSLYSSHAREFDVCANSRP